MTQDAAEPPGGVAVLPADAAGSTGPGTLGRSRGRARGTGRATEPSAAEPSAAEPSAAEPSAAKSSAAAPPPDAVLSGRGGRSEAFVVELDNFSGPFDLLLSLIAKHKLDVTEVALSQVTDEFVAHLRRLGDRFDLGQATEFLVVASTLLDLKAARLLPGATSDDDNEDLALLEARDLLFARLLQYKAYKEAASIFVGLIALEARFTPRAVPLEPRYVAVLPEVKIGVTPAELAVIAARLREPPLPPQVAVDHVHVPRVNVRDHMLAVVELLRELGTASFRVLCRGCKQTIEVVARFLALLELYREGRLAFEQDVPLGELIVRWVDTGGEFDPSQVGTGVSEFDGDDAVAANQTDGQDDDG